MDQIADIPVRDPNGKLIGKARIVNDGDDYVAHINIDPELGKLMVSAMTEGMVTGLSVGTEITPVMKSPNSDVVSKHPHVADFDLDPGNRSIGFPEIEARFGFHKGTIEGPNATVPRHAYLRNEFKDFAGMLDALLPRGRAKDEALVELENSSMWAHKAIANTAPVEE